MGLEPKFWQRFCEATGHPELLEHQFAAPGSEGHAQVAAVFRERTRQQWLAFNDKHDAMIEPVLDLDQALDSELVREREMVVEIEQPEIGPVRLLGVPVKLSRTAGDPTRPAPALGEHTDDVLAAAGFSGREIDELLSSGAAARVEESTTARFMG